MKKFHKFTIISMIMFLLIVSFVSASSVTRYVGTIAEVNGGDVTFKVNDRLGSQRVIVNESGDVTAEYLSLPYGQTIIDNGSKYGFTGKEKDASSGMHYFGARYYDSDIGRFTSVDPVGSNHAYSYVSNKPMNYVDPDGRKMLLFPDGDSLILENGQTLDEELMHPEDADEIINCLNSFFDGEVFEYNNGGYVEPIRSYSGGTEDQKLLYRIIMDVIGHKDTIKVSYNIKFETAFHIVFREYTDLLYVVVGYNAQQDEFNFGEVTENIQLTKGIALIHELGHARAYLLTQNKENDKTYGETVAVTAENVARRIKGMDERVYYITYVPKGIEVFDGEYMAKIYGLTPYEYDYNKEPIFIKKWLLSDE